LEKQKEISNSNIKEDNLSSEFSKLQIIQSDNIKKTCNFQGYNIDNLMEETSQLRKLIIKKGNH
jgi:hypothetical protein